MLDAVATLWTSGGFVMPPLVLASLMLWYALGYRAVLLRRCVLLEARAVLATLSTQDRASHDAVDAALAPLRGELPAFARLVTSMVALSPLVGLLGTVTGMIETFASLGDQTLFARTGGIAGGIAQALVSTQMGLAVAIPGLLAGRLLARRQAALQDSLAELAAATVAAATPDAPRMAA